MYKKHFEKVLALAMVFFCLLSLTGFPVRAEGGLKSPGDLTLERVSNGVRVSWSSSGGADVYAVYRSVNNGLMRSKPYAKTSDLFFVDTDVSEGNLYEYCVEAWKLNAAGDPVQKARSGSENILLLGVVSSLTCTATEYGDILVRWDATETAIDFDVYYSTDGSAPSASSQPVQHGSDRFYFLADPEIGKTYTFYVRKYYVSDYGETAYPGPWSEGVSITAVKEEKEEEKDKSSLSEEEKAVAEAVATQILPGMSQYEKAIALHDWLTRRCEPDYSGSNPSSHVAYGALIKGLAVCQGYTEAYAMLLDAVGIENTRAYGTDHMWNVAKLDGHWCHIDVTWDDGGGTSHVYFGVTDRALEGVEHHENKSPTVSCSSWESSYAYKSGKLQQICEDWQLTAAERIRNGETTFEVSSRLKTSTATAERMAADMLSSSGVDVDGTQYAVRAVYERIDLNYGHVIVSVLNYVRGDANMDGLFDGRDVVHLMKWLAEDEGADIDPDNADMNGDGTVDERDLIRMIQELSQ